MVKLETAAQSEFQEKFLSHVMRSYDWHKTSGMINLGEHG